MATTDNGPQDPKSSNLGDSSSIFVEGAAVQVAQTAVTTTTDATQATTPVAAPAAAAAAAPAAAAEEALPSPWREEMSKTHPGKVYFFNPNTGKSSWTRPENWLARAKTAEAVRQANIDELVDQKKNR